MTAPFHVLALAGLVCCVSTFIYFFYLLTPWHVWVSLKCSKLWE